MSLEKLERCLGGMSNNLQTSHEESYHRCRGLALDLLNVVEQRDLSGIDENLRRLRRDLSQRPLLPAEAAGNRLLREERMEALEAVAEEMDLSLRFLADSIQRGMEKLAGAKSLLRHLTATHEVSADEILPRC